MKMLRIKLFWQIKKWKMYPKYFCCSTRRKITVFVKAVTLIVYVAVFRSLKSIKSTASKIDKRFYLKNQIHMFCILFPSKTFRYNPVSIIHFVHFRTDDIDVTPLRNLVVKLRIKSSLGPTTQQKQLFGNPLYYIPLIRE